MGELTTNVSWMAVIVGAIASFLLGWLWYSERLFGEKWAVGVGVELGKVHAITVNNFQTSLVDKFIGCICFGGKRKIATSPMIISAYVRGKAQAREGN